MENNKPPTRYEIHAATPGWAFIFTQAANAIHSEYSPHDVHCDIEPQVAHVMGFYMGASGKHEEDALGMILQDLAIITDMLTKDKGVYPQPKDASGALGHWNAPDNSLGVRITDSHVTIDMVPAVHHMSIGFDEETGRTMLSIEHTNSVDNGDFE